MTESKKNQLLNELAQELKRKHDMELYKECLEIGSMIFELTKKIEND